MAKRGLLSRAALLYPSWCHRPISSYGRDLPQTTGQKRNVHKLWRDFFSDPCQWWDNRLDKENPKYPDFKHKKTQEGLWLDGKFNPPWVGAELAALRPGTIQPHIFSWNKKLVRHANAGHYEKTLELFQQMQTEGINPDTFSFVAVLTACSSVGDLQVGKHIHTQIIQSGCELNVYVGSCLVDMYCKCKSIEDAWGVFNKLRTHDVVSWNAMILGYVKCGHGEKALELYLQMEQEGLDPSPATFVGVLNACASIAALEEGRRHHEQIIQRGFESDVFVSNSLIDMYTKCGSVGDAWIVFSRMPNRDVVTWSAMILGYAKCGQGQKALELYREMLREGVEPNPVTFAGVLNACASVASLGEGRLVHEQIMQRGCLHDVFVGSSLVDMYAKCGSIEDAERVFKKMPVRNVVAWTAMIGGYAMHGLAKEALLHVEQMSQEHIGLNGITFVSVLSACSHAGLVDEGLHYFKSMSAMHGLPAAVDHYACVVDLLGRAGRLHEAEDLIKTMSCDPDLTVWMSLLGACRVHGNVEMGEHIAREVVESEPGNTAAYVLLSNIYAASGKWDSSALVKRQSLERGATRHLGCAWIEVDHKVHVFTADDQQHPQIMDIRAELRRLSRHMNEAGYVANTSFVLHDVEQEEKVFRLCHHSERLAIGFGLITSPPSTTLRIFKNLRMCGDCHSAIKMIAKMVGRLIIVRDANRFHHFQDDLCSCNDYW